MEFNTAEIAYTPTMGVRRLHETPLVAASEANLKGYVIAVGTPVTERPPHRTVRAGFPHTAPTSGV
jgi:hypothetical protein